MLVQFFKGVHRSRMYVCAFIGGDCTRIFSFLNILSDYNLHQFFLWVIKTLHGRAIVAMLPRRCILWHQEAFGWSCECCLLGSFVRSYRAIDSSCVYDLRCAVGGSCWCLLTEWTQRRRTSKCKTEQKQGNASAFEFMWILFCYKSNEEIHDDHKDEDCTFSTCRITQSDKCQRCS